MAGVIAVYRDAPGETGVDHHLPHTQPEEKAQMIFYAVVEGGVEQIEIFLDERLREMIHEPDDATWQGIIEFVDDHLVRER